MAEQPISHRKGYEPNRFIGAVSETLAVELGRYEKFTRLRSRDEALLILAEVRLQVGGGLTWRMVCELLNAHFDCEMRETDVKTILTQAKRRSEMPSPASFFAAVATNGKA